MLDVVLREPIKKQLRLKFNYRIENSVWQVEIIVRKYGLFYKDGEIAFSKLKSFLSNAISGKKTVELIIRSNRDVLFGRLAEIMDIARKSGIRKIHFAVEK